jgi:2-polyprenyl-3-methyl-5-hydroxy-6-metoxy-1,4-benzoquinol methylase
MTVTHELAYGGTTNDRLLQVFQPGARLLDIGCGEGAWAPLLRKRGVSSLVGVEMSEPSALRANRLYDAVVCEAIENVTMSDLGGRQFDTIVAADVLEHLVNPWEELRRWRDWVPRGGQLVVSIPNLRDGRLLMRLALRGRFDYSDTGGVMDRTHLRWFTSASLIEDLRTAGWMVRRRGGTCGPWRGQLNRLTGRLFEDVLAYQVHLVAEAVG